MSFISAGVPAGHFYVVMGRDSHRGEGAVLGVSPQALVWMDSLV